MQLFLFLMLASSALARVAQFTNGTLAPVMRKGSLLLANDRPWKAVGPNVYWLGLDENVVPPAGEPYDAATKSSYPTKGRITDVMATVQALGGTMIRTHTLGVSVGNPLSVMPKLGVINEAAFEAIDWAVYQAGLFGIRLMVPLVDNYDYYHGGKYTFLRWAGLSLTQNQDSNNPAIQQFYTNATIVASFKDYIQKLVTHKNQYNGLTYAEDPTIFAYETGNELSGPVWGDMNCPGSWVEDIVKFVKGLAPAKLFVDGTYGINKTHLGIEEADIFSDHFYPVDTTKLRQGIAAVGGASKAYFAGEYDWIGGQAENLASFFDIIEKSSMACGDTFWSLFGRNLPNCSAFVNHNDGLTMQYGNPANSAQVNSRIQLIRKHGTAMSVGTDIGANATLPSVPCPAPSPR